MGYVEESKILLNEELCGRQIKRDDPITKATILFRENVKLVYYVAKKFPEPRDPAVDTDDIIQSGYEGLWKACNNFDESKGCEFSTYAVPMIRGTILLMLRGTDILKVPRIYRDMRSALSSHGFTLPLSPEEVDVLVSEGRFSRKQIMDYAEPTILSLDSPTTEDENTNLSSVIPDPNTCLERSLSDDEIESLVDSVLKYIKPIHRDLVEEWMYATLAGVKLSQGELGNKYNKSQVQVSRILKYAIYIVHMHKNEIKDMFGY